ncbi:LysR family transcriptional regulator [Aestuariibius insulae]|uniref:LysR family transcriptional regulator n=1 Tax=Aestuariibius insulae TaxID=2058287 RepID=UPI00345E89BB
MNELDIRLFLRLADRLHFGQTAQAENIAQSALSARIKALETELGAQLFERSTRTVSLTAPGRAFIPEATALLTQMRRAEQVVRRTATQNYRSLKIGGVDSALSGPLPGIVKTFLTKQPNVHITLIEMLSHITDPALTARRVDIGFLRYAPTNPEIDSFLLKAEGMSVAMPEDHPLASRQTLTAADIAANPLILQSRAQRPILHDCVRRYIEAAGHEFSIDQEANERHMLLSLVAAGLGLTLVPDWVTMFRREGVVYREMEDGGPQLQIMMAWRGDDPLDTVHEFVAAVRKEFGRR